MKEQEIKPSSIQLKAYSKTEVAALYKMSPKSLSRLSKYLISQNPVAFCNFFASKNERCSRSQPNNHTHLPTF
jgi:hypothetical protein